MKSLKRFSFVAILAVVVTMFSSCLGDNDDSEAIIGPYLLTVEDYLGTKIMKPDYLPDYTFVPSNPTALGNFKRAYLYLKVPADTDLKTGGRYDVTIYTGVGVTVKEILNMPEEGSVADTLKNESVSSFGLMSVYNNYVTTAALLSGVSKYYVDMVKDKVANDTLYLNLNVNLEKGNYSDETYNSFVMPDSRTLKQEGITPLNDSIVVAVSAEVYSNHKKEKQTNYLKYKLN